MAFPPRAGTAVRIASFNARFGGQQVIIAILDLLKKVDVLLVQGWDYGVKGPLHKDVQPRLREHCDVLNTIGFRVCDFPALVVKCVFVL